MNYDMTDPEFLRDMVDAYISCALWSTTDDSTPEGGSPMEETYGPDNIDLQSHLQMQSDCAQFLVDACETLDAMENPLTPEKIGYNFWLTRCGHGAGFWDLGLGADGERLSHVSRTAGNVDLYVGDDGKIYMD